jgi:hypothetical protein
VDNYDHGFNLRVIFNLTPQGRETVVQTSSYLAAFPGLEIVTMVKVRIIDPSMSLYKT